ncbi:MAG: hypothetical protein WC500_05470, partial [Candidatus Margulisiibacteriota bacterium]
ALLQQGSIFVRRIPDDVLAVLRRASPRATAITVEELAQREVGFEELVGAITAGFISVFGRVFEPV